MTAVAGYVHRLVPRPDFQLSARLAGVAHLNTRSGRKPMTRACKLFNAKAQPKLIPASRKRSPYAFTPNLRTKANPPIGPAAVILAIKPARDRTAIAPGDRVAQAA